MLTLRLALALVIVGMFLAAARGADAFESQKEKYFAKGKSPVVRVVDNYLVKNDKPWFRHHVHTWNAGLEKSFFNYQRYYCFGNEISSGHTNVVQDPKGKNRLGTKFFMGYDAPDWLEKFKAETFNPRAVELANECYRNKYLFSFYAHGIQGVVHDVMANDPNAHEVWLDRGTEKTPEANKAKLVAKYDNDIAKLNKDWGSHFNSFEDVVRNVDEAPAMGSKRFAELLQKEVQGIVEQWKDHPAMAEYELWEEYAVCNHFWNEAKAFAAPASVAYYQNWLKKKYKDIGALNSEWGSSYKGFEEIQPETRAFSPNFINSLRCRIDGNGQWIQVMYDAAKKADKNHPIAGCKGGSLLGDVYWPKYADVTEALLPLIKADKSKVLELPGNLECPMFKTKQGSDAVCTILTLNKLMELMSEDNLRKDQYCFYRNGGYAHILETVFSCGMRAEWEETYQDTSANHYFHRTKVLEQQVKSGAARSWGGRKVEVYPEAFDFAPATVDDWALRMSRAYQFLYRAAPLVLPTQPVDAEVAILRTMESVRAQDEFSGYLGNIYGFMPTMFTQIQTPYEVLQDFMIAGNLTYPRYKVAVISPLICTATKDQVQAIRKFVESGGALIFIGNRGLKFDTGTCKPIAFDAGKGGKVFNVTGFDGIYDMGAVKNVDKPKLRSTLQGMLKECGVGPLVKVTGDERSAWLVTALNKGSGYGGKNYWIASVGNYSDYDQKVTMQVSGLPAGKYEVVEITGERPIVKKNDKKENHLVADPEFRYAKFVLKETDDRTLREKGIPDVDVMALGGRIFLIRAAGESVAVDCPEYELKALCQGEVDIVAGSKLSAKEQEKVAELQKALAAKGVKVKVVRDSEVKLGDTTKEIKIDDYVVDVFHNKPLETTRNLIVVGPEDTNTLARHLGAVDTFTYDKVIEKVTAGYPGAGARRDPGCGVDQRLRLRRHGHLARGDPGRRVRCRGHDQGH